MIDTDQPSGELRYLRLPEVMKRTGLCRSQLYNMMAKDQFPKPIKEGRASLWPSTTFEQWMRAKANA
jgi:prophage regulatory protein